MLLGRQRRTHEGDHAFREQGVLRRFVDACRPVPTEPHIHEPCSPELVGEDTLRQGASYSPSPSALIVRDLGRELTVDGEIGKRDPTTWYQDAVDLSERTALAPREVQDAVRDHDIDGRIREGDLLHLALQELSPTFDACLDGVRACPITHRFDDVEPDHLAGRPDPSRREDRADQEPGTYAEDDLARLLERESHGNPDADRPAPCPHGHLRHLFLPVDLAD